MREEDEERTTAARDVPAEVQRLEPPTRAPARVRERAFSPSAVDAAPREGSEKSLRACACREAHDEHEQMQRVGTTCQR